MPRHHVGAILTFLNVSAVLCFYVVMIFLKISLCIFSSANIIQIIDLNQIYLFFYAKKSRKRLRYLLLLCVPNKVITQHPYCHELLR